MRIAILISGTGSNMEALVEDLATHPDADIVLVASDKPDAKGLAWAENQKIPTWSPSKAYAEADLLSVLRFNNIELVLLAGFMRLVSGEFLSYWPNHVLNIHPSLLPEFPGLNTHQRAIDAGAKTHGCTVHFVDEGMDTGQIIEQAQVEVLETDTSDQLAARVLEQEHLLYPKVVRELLTTKTRPSLNS